MKPEQTVDFHIRKAWQKILRMYNGIAAQYGTSMSVGYLLLNIDKDGTPATLLGPKVGIEKSSLSRTLKQMEEAGMIYRRPDKIDRRINRIFITDQGLENRKLARQVVVNFNQMVQTEIPADKLAIFEEVVSQITDIAMREDLRKEY